MKREFERTAWYDKERQCVVLMSRLFDRSLQMVLGDNETAKDTYEFLEHKLELWLFVQELPSDTKVSECSNCPRTIYQEKGSVWMHMESETSMMECDKAHPISCRKDNCKSKNCRG